MNQFEKNTLFANRYQLIEKLGMGGYSEVWKAEDNFANKMLVGIKIFAPDKGLDKSGLELFGKEYTLVFNLNHPNLLKPMHYDVYKDSPYLVLQYCSKGSLYQKIGKLSETDITVFIHQAASALAYLHGQETPIIHQDIKPDNFLIDNNSNYLLADFGISSKIRRTLTRSMGEKASTGTMAYMPPEKFSRERQTIKAGDIFSLGVCIYELLTGDLPFGEHGGVAMLSGAEIPDLPKAFSPQLNELLRSCLAKDAWDRPTAETLMEIAKSYELSGKWDITKLSLTKQEVAKEPQIISKEEEKPKAIETIQMPVKEVETEKKQLKAKTATDSYGKYILIFGIFIALMFTIIYFTKNNGPTSEEKAAIEQLIQDSLAQVEQIRINDSIVAAELEKNDSIAFTEQQTKKLKIGSNYAGGIIFYLDKTGQHGKVCAQYDQSTSATWNEATMICNNLTLNGYSDWYLPSKNELRLMYKNLHTKHLGDFSEYYWSSSEYSSNGAWSFTFGNGGTDFNYKYYAYHVRVVRAF